MQKAFFIIVFLLNIFTVRKSSGQDLINNGNFEEYTDCPLTFSSGSNIVLTDWQVPTSAGSPDYFHVCGILPGVQVPNNQFGSQIPHSGDGYIGLYNYGNSGYREYLQIALNAPLEAGCKYYAEMYVSLADSLASCGTDRLGLFFSQNPPENFEPFYAGILLDPSEESYQAQVENPPGQLLSNSAGWTKISGTFTAEGNERYLTIGNFAKNAEVLVPSDCSAEWQSPFTTPEQPVSYYYIDDVKVAKACLSISGTETICPGETVTLTAAGSYSDSHHWFDTANPAIELSGTHTLQVSPLETVTYAVADQYDTAYFTVELLTAATLDLGSDTLLCQGATLVLNAGNFNDASYRWEDGSSNRERVISEGGLYAVTVTIGNCEATDDILVEYEDATEVAISLGDDINLCLGDTFELKPQLSGIGDIIWNDGSQEETQTLYAPGIVWATLENECFTASDTIRVSFEQCCRVYLPNAFSPNLDGINDEFRLFSGCEIEIVRMNIFNRWGAKVFESKDPSVGWDGTFKGKFVSSGTYAWFVEYKLPGEQHTYQKKGMVTLFRQRK